MKPSGLNHIYCVVWCASKGLWQAVSEFGRGKGKSRSRGKLALRRAISGAGTLALISGQAMAGGLPSQGTITGGSGQIGQQGPDMLIQQNSDRLAIDWQDFSIGKNNTVTFQQPGSQSVALNRVTGGSVSEIRGALNANGQVFLVNTAGVLFSDSAQVNVGGIVASTLDISPEDFMAGRYTFEGDSSAAIINRGEIIATDGGYVAMIAARIHNEGDIQATGGSVQMAAGRRVTLDMGGTVRLSVEEAALEALIDNGGAIRADGGTVLLTAHAAGDLASTVINHSGVIEAQTLASGANGEIRLLGDGGSVEIAGSLDASAPNGGNGGVIETSGPRVSIDPSASVSTLAADGSAGTYRIDPTDIFVVSDCAEAGASTCLPPAAIEFLLLSNNLIIETDSTDTGPDAGDIFINNNINFTGANNRVLHFMAHRDILVDDGVGISSANSALTTVFQTNRTGGDGGVVHFGDGASVNTNGGEIIVTGGDIALLPNDQSDLAALRSGGTTLGRSGTLDAIRLGEGAELNTTAAGDPATGGDITLRGQAFWDSDTTTEGRALNLAGAIGDEAVINAGTGQLTIANNGTNSSSTVLMNHAVITAGNDNFSLEARSRTTTGLRIHNTELNLGHDSLSLVGRRVGTQGGAGMGLNLEAVDISRTGGDIYLEGRSVAGDGVRLTEVNLQTDGDGSISLLGRMSSNSGDGRGVSLEGGIGRSAIQTENGNLGIDGSSAKKSGVHLEAYDLTTSSGALQILGDKSSANTITGDENGLNLVDASLVTDDGNITLFGRTTRTERSGLFVDADSDVLSASGDIELRGENAHNTNGTDNASDIRGRIGAASGTAVTASSSDIAILADNLNVTGDTRIETSGEVTIDRTTSGSMAIGSYLSTSWLNVPVSFLETQIHGASRLVLGGTASTFRVNSAITLAHDTDILTSGTFHLAQDLSTAHNLRIGHTGASSEASKYRIFSDRSITFTDYQSQSFHLGAVTDLDTSEYTLIGSLADFEDIAQDLNGRYALAADLDLGGASIAALGDSDTPFTGTLAGLGNTLSNVSVDAPALDNQGLFGVLDSALIRNLQLSDIAVTGQNQVGVLAGHAMNSQILSSRIWGGTGSAVTGENNVGGLIGQVDSSDLRGQGTEWNLTSNDVTVTATGNNIGAMAGSASSSTFSSVTVSADAAVAASAAGSQNIGGLVGLGDSLTVTSTFSTGSITTSADQSNIGGLVGLMTGGTLGGNSHSSTTISSSAGLSNVGGLVGRGDESTISNAYRNGALDISGNNLTNFGGIVGFNDNGTVEDTHVRNNLNAEGTSIGGIVGLNTGTIDSSYIQYTFWNTVTTSTNGSAGTRNVTLTASGSEIGGIVGRNEGDVTRSYVDMTIDAATGDFVGGIAGFNADGALIGNSYVLAMDTSDDANIIGGGRSITGNDYVGGLVGFNEADGTVSTSYAAVTISGTTNVNGLVGGGFGTVTASFWDTDLTGVGQDGGVGEGRSTAELHDRQTYLDAGWDLSNVGGDGTTWRIFDDSDMFDDVYAPRSRPMLRNFFTSSFTVGSNSPSFEYDGSTRSWEGSTVGSIANTNQTRNPDTNNQIYGDGVLGRVGFDEFDDPIFGVRNAGVYDLEFNGSYYSHQHGYDISYGSQTLTINARQINVVVTDASDKVYDGTNVAAVTATVNRTNLGGGSAFIGGDDVNVPGSSGGQFASTDVGNDITVIANTETFQLEGADAGNYQINSVTGPEGGLSANITPATLTLIENVAVADREYDGTTDVADFDFSGVTLTEDTLGALSSESVLHAEILALLEIDGSGQYGAADVGTYTLNVGTGDVSFNDLVQGNILLNLGAGFSVADVEITPRILDMGDTLSALTRDYDGTSAVTGLASLPLENLVDGESLDIDFVSGSYSSANAGTYNNVEVTFDVIEGGGTTASNYQLDGTVLGSGPLTLSGLSGRINRKELTLTGTFDVADKEYDGSATATVTDNSGLSLAGLVGSENFDLSQVNQAEFAQADAGDNLTVSITGASLPETGTNGALASNYILDLSTPITTTATINPRMLEITADDAARLYGDNNPTLTAGITGGSLAPVHSDIQAAFADFSVGTAADNLSDAGAYDITVAATNSNYDLSIVNGTLTVSPREITVRGDDASRIYGDSNPTLSASITSGTLADHHNSLDDALDDYDVTTPATAESDVGSYAINAEGTSGNYTVTFEHGTLDILQRAITLTADSDSRLYGDANPTLGASVTSGSLAPHQSALDLSDVFAGFDVTTPATVTSGVGNYNTVVGGTNANYNISVVNGTLTINQRPLTVTPEDLSRIYGNDNPSFGNLIGDNLVNGDTLGQASLGSNASVTSDVGNYDLTISNAPFTSGTGANYDITLADGVLTVTERPITVTANDLDKVYGETDPDLTWAVTSGNLITGDQLSGGLDRAAGEDVGNYAITQGALANSNYDITFVDGELTITLRPITVAADNLDKVYGEADPALSWSVTEGNLVGDDTLDGAVTRDAGENVGNYTIDPSNLANGNYDITFADGVLTITARPITVTADNQEKTYGEDDPALTWTVTEGDLVGGDTLTGDLTRESGENVGSYSISAADLANGNYAITVVDGTLAIVPREVIVRADNQSKTAGRPDPQLTFRVESEGNGRGLLSGDSLSGELTRESGESFGAYTILQGSLDQSNNPNYDIDYRAASLTIGERQQPETTRSAVENAQATATQQVTATPQLTPPTTVPEPSGLVTVTTGGIRLLQADEDGQTADGTSLGQFLLRDGGRDAQGYMRVMVMGGGIRMPDTGNDDNGGAL